MNIETWQVGWLWNVFVAAVILLGVPGIIWLSALALAENRKRKALQRDILDRGAVGAAGVMVVLVAVFALLSYMHNSYFYG